MPSTYAHNVNKHPDSERTFALDLTDWLAQFEGSIVITTAVWDAPDFTVVGTPGLDGTSKKASAKLKGGTVALQRYPVECLITASNGEIQPFTFMVQVVSP